MDSIHGATENLENYCYRMYLVTVLPASNENFSFDLLVLRYGVTPRAV
jgi:hypothetical protein